MFTNAEFVAVSDIHLEHPGDDRGRVLLEVIDACISSNVQCFALLGDIFDFCLGGTGYFSKKFAAVGERLEALAASGTRVVFIEGNHEFALAKMGWRGVEVVSESERERGMTWRSASGKKILMTHGDLFYAPDTYLAFRKLIKSRPSLFAVSMIPGLLMDAYALRHARASRSRDPYRIINESAILEDARKFAGEKEADHLLFGHFHIPWAEPLRDKNGEGSSDSLLLCMNSWDKPNVLIFDGKNFHRGFGTAPGKPMAFSPAFKAQT